MANDMMAPVASYYQRETTAFMRQVVATIKQVAPIHCADVARHLDERQHEQPRAASTHVFRLELMTLVETALATFVDLDTIDRVRQSVADRHLMRRDEQKRRRHIAMDHMANTLGRDGE